MSGVGMMLLGLGSTGDVITIANRTISDLAIAPDNASARYQLNANGIAYEITNAGGTFTIGNWVTPTSAAPNYEVYATLVAGSLSTGTTGSWLALSSSLAWVCLFSGNLGGLGAQITVDIRKIGTTTVLDTANITLNASVE